MRHFVSSSRRPPLAFTLALGYRPRAGQKVLSVQSLPSTVTASTPEVRVNAHGFSLHAAVRWRADQRKELEQLCRYITRPAIANERLKRNRTGQVVLRLKSPYKDGTTHILEPLEFIERPAALVPRPRLRLIRFHGVLAPNAKLRSKFVSAPAEDATESLSEDTDARRSQLDLKGKSEPVSALLIAGVPSAKDWSEPHSLRGLTAPGSIH